MIRTFNRVSDISGRQLFSEEQRFPRWLGLFLILPLLMVLGFLLWLWNSGEEEKQELIIALAIVIPINVILFSYFLTSRFEKVVTSNGLYFRWRPWQSRYRWLQYSEIRDVRVRQAPPMKYGTGPTFSYGWVHIANGRRGLQLTMTNGKKLFLGAKDVEEFSKAVNAMIRAQDKNYERLHR